MNNVNPADRPGQLEPDQSDPLSLGYVAEVLLASDEQWGALPDPYPLMGREFLDGVLTGAGDG